MPSMISNLRFALTLVRHLRQCSTTTITIQQLAILAAGFALQVDEEAKRLMEFIVRSVGYIDITNVSSQVSVFIHTRFKDAVDSDGNLRICVLIKELLEFQDHLRKNLVVEDAMTGLTAVDKGNVELYLKVISQITQLYKAETSNMLFGSEET